MSEKLREALSAAMDGEADDFELRRLIDEASNDAELREQWHRYHLVRDVMRGEWRSEFDGLRARVHQEMADADLEQSDAPDADIDVTLKAADAGPKSNWIGRATGAAVAAAAAILVVVNADLFRGDSATPVDLVTNTEALERSLPVMYTEATATDRLRLDGHRMQHYQQNAINRAGAVSFVRMATFRQMPQGAAREEAERVERQP